MRDLLARPGRSRVTSAHGLIVAALLLAGSGRTRAAAERPAVLREVAFEQRIGEGVPLEVGFRDESGRTVELREYFGTRPVVLVPAYYECPMLCTLVVNGVVSVLRALSFDAGREFDVVVFSFNPRETAELAAKKKEGVLGEYRRAGAAAGWHFLTGDEEAIRRLTGAIGFRYAWDAAQRQYAHASGVVVLTPDGQIARYFYGVEFSPRDLRLALVEAAAGRIGSVVDRLLLFCFHYDATTGRYGALAIGAVRLGGLATLAGLIGFVVVMLRRDAAGT